MKQLHKQRWCGAGSGSNWVGPKMQTHRTRFNVSEESRMTNTVWGSRSPTFWSSGSSPVRFCSPVWMCCGLTADISPEAGRRFPQTVSEAVRILRAAGGTALITAASCLRSWLTERRRRRLRVRSRRRWSWSPVCWNRVRAGWTADWLTAGQTDRHSQHRCTRHRIISRVLLNKLGKTGLNVTDSVNEFLSLFSKITFFTVSKS